MVKALPLEVRAVVVQVAVLWLLPVVRVLVLPSEHERVTDPADALTAENVMLPVGAPEPPPLGATVAVKTVDWPVTGVPAGLVFTTVVVVLDLLTVWVSVPEVLELKLPSPP